MIHEEYMFVQNAKSLPISMNFSCVRTLPFLLTKLN